VGVGYLDELKRQAEAARARNTQDIGALQRNAMLTDSACQAAARYLSTLAQQLNVLQPMSKATWRLDNRIPSTSSASPTSAPTRG
jgi:hypothetical protein